MFFFISLYELTWAATAEKVAKMEENFIFIFNFKKGSLELPLLVFCNIGRLDDSSSRWRVLKYAQRGAVSATPPGGKRIIAIALEKRMSTHSGEYAVTISCGKLGNRNRSKYRHRNPSGSLEKFQISSRGGFVNPWLGGDLEYSKTRCNNHS